MIELHHITRRRLLTAMALSPLLWRMNTASAAAIDPQRIVALEWLPVELLLALGITPYGIADIPNYKLWVSEPPLPDSVIDVGLRTEPNLELLTEMKPSFLLWSAGYGPSPEKLARIALVGDLTSATVKNLWSLRDNRCRKWRNCSICRTLLNAI